MKILAEVTIPSDSPWIKRMDCEARIKEAVVEGLNMIPGLQVEVKEKIPKPKVTPKKK